MRDGRDHGFAASRPGSVLHGCIGALCFLAPACAEPTGPERGDVGEQETRADARAPDYPVDEFGYAIVGEDVFPALHERVEALACPNVDRLPMQCSKDDDCGPGFACLCGFFQGLGLVDRQCVPAECRSAADCDGGRCLLSLGSRPDDCCAYGRLGLVCSRSASTCRHGGDCPGNGIACIYDSGLDRFECTPLGCMCD
jgi:hypothetical protein